MRTKKRITEQVIDTALAGAIGLAASSALKELPPARDLLQMEARLRYATEKPQELWNPHPLEQNYSNMPAKQGRMAAEYLVTSTSDRPTVTPPGMTAYKFS